MVQLMVCLALFLLGAREYPQSVQLMKKSFLHNDKYKYSCTALIRLIEIRNWYLLIEKPRTMRTITTLLYTQHRGLKFIHKYIIFISNGMYNTYFNRLMGGGVYIVCIYEYMNFKLLKQKLKFFFNLNYVYKWSFY